MEYWLVVSYELFWPTTLLIAPLPWNCDFFCIWLLIECLVTIRSYYDLFSWYNVNCDITFLRTSCCSKMIRISLNTLLIEHTCLPTYFCFLSAVVGVLVYKLLTSLDNCLGDFSLHSGQLSKFLSKSNFLIYLQQSSLSTWRVQVLNVIEILQEVYVCIFFIAQACEESDKSPKKWSWIKQTPMACLFSPWRTQLLERCFHLFAIYLYYILSMCMSLGTSSFF